LFYRDWNGVPWDLEQISLGYCEILERLKASKQELLEVEQRLEHSTGPKSTLHGFLYRYHKTKYDIEKSLITFWKVCFESEALYWTIGGLVRHLENSRRDSTRLMHASLWPVIITI
jgi:hypothetical protein